MDIIDGSGLWLGGTKAPSGSDVLLFHRPRIDTVWTPSGHRIIVRVVFFMLSVLELGA